MLATLARGHREDVDAAVAAARRAFEGPWSRCTQHQRCALMLRVCDVLEKKLRGTRDARITLHGCADLSHSCDEERPAPDGHVLYAFREPHPCAVDDGVVKVVLRGEGGRRRGGRGGVLGRPPVVRQQLREVALLERGQALEHVLEVGPRIVPVEFGRLCRPLNYAERARFSPDLS
ncbi:aldehyde dehydrogenase family protein [Rhodoferax sediminis]|uniref:Aldehyde dehydrogenase family protein n=1 Tax=Rhodoferax sediminis TaxID=2509614 RepID=A0A515DDZ9_9BURK|nr:aldehyde dehydrogenase family protein [Rhodoferax sediminis]